MPTIKNIPETIIISEERKHIDSQLRARLREAQDSYASLRDDPELTNVPPAHACTQAWLSAIHEQKRKAVDDALFLTEEQRSTQRARLGRIYKRLSALVSTVQAFILSIPNEQYTWNDALRTFHIRDIDSLVSVRATRQVPPQAELHWAKIHDVLHAIKDLRQWEEKEDLKKIPLEKLLRFPMQPFVESWVTGNIRRDHSFDDRPYMAAIIQQQKENEKHYL